MEMTSVMYLRAGKSKKLIQIADFMEAKSMHKKIEADLHARMIFKTPFIDILDGNFETIGCISPNGRIWDNNHMEIKF